MEVMEQTSFQSHAARGATKHIDVVARPVSVAVNTAMNAAVKIALVALLLAIPFSAQARQETIRWSHSTVDVAGFRVYSSLTTGSSGSQQLDDLLLGEAGQDVDGNFFHTITVADSDSVYITLTAYSDQDIESLRSNEKLLTPPDRDNDGYFDFEDAFPDDPTEWADTDLDGYGDNSDRFPNDSTEWDDSDNDGYGDNGDWAPTDPTEWADSDLDGYGDNIDAFPNDPTRFEFSVTLSPYRVNAGESQDFVAQDGRTWTRDAGFWNTGISNTVGSGVQIINTTSDEIYQSSRTDLDTGDEMMFSFPLTNGSYTVRLHFAEFTFTQAGQRLFDVEIEGNTMLADFDIFAAAFGRYRAVIRNLTVDVADGLLEIEFLHIPGRSDPTVMGIEIVSNEALEGEVLTTPSRPALIDVN